VRGGETPLQRLVKEKNSKRAARQKAHGVPLKKKVTSQVGAVNSEKRRKEVPVGRSQSRSHPHPQGTGVDPRQNNAIERETSNSPAQEGAKEISSVSAHTSPRIQKKNFPGALSTKRKGSTERNQGEGGSKK